MNVVSLCILMIALFFSPSILRTLGSGSGQGNMLVLSAGMNVVNADLGNNYGLGETRKKELHDACSSLGITRQDRCVVLDQAYIANDYSDVVLSKTIRNNGGIRIPWPKL